LPLAVIVLRSSGEIPISRFVPVILVAAVLALANYAALAAAYRRADLSLVYPVARGGVFLFLPLLGFLVFRERLDARGWFALAMIVGGILLLPLARLDRAASGSLGRHLREPFVTFALLAAAATAGYTVWDKYAVGFLDTFLYFYGYTALLALWFAVTLARTPGEEVRDAARRHPVSIIMIGLLNAGAYLLILVALREGMTTQVLAVRQLSIPIGVLLGWRLLRESLTPPRAIGATLITAGCVLAALI
jgi:drug/metabolite transporter (DMT)-like permease